MKQKSLPTYKDLNKALSQTTLKLHPSELHGLICGILCGDLNTHSAWETFKISSQEIVQTQILKDVFDVSALELNEWLFDFQLILPLDAEELPIRAEALTLWAQGFLTGLKHVHVQIVDRPPSDMTEAIHDLIEIAKMNYEEVISSEEDETAYVELVEYVRMAVILIYQDMRDQNNTKQPMNAIHHLH